MARRPTRWSVGSAVPRLNEYELQGTWTRAAEPLTLRSDSGKVGGFSAAKLHLIAGAPQPAPVRVRVNGGAEQTVEIGLPTLYTVFDGGSYGEHLPRARECYAQPDAIQSTFG